jgi:hypothetical protein
VSKAGPEKIKLSEVFRSIKPTHVLGTTFTLSLAFFESIVRPFISREKLERLVILCDRIGYHAAMSEAAAVRAAGREYLVATTDTAGAFHPKVWILVNDDEMVLLVGSGNLTQHGFIENVEMFDHVRITKGGGGLELVAACIQFVEGLNKMWSPETGESLVCQSLATLVTALRRISSSLSIGGVDDEVRFISTFSGNLVDAIRLPDVDRLHVAAPYFGGSVSGVNDLRERLNNPHMVVYPAAHSDGTIDLPVDKLEDGIGVKSIDWCPSGRFAHLKLFGFECSDKSNWLLTGSYNCTLAALSGPNIEAGLLRACSSLEIERYFASGKLVVDEFSRHSFDSQASAAPVLIRATDHGSRIEVALIGKLKFPIRDATIELRSGQSIVSAAIGDVFIQLDRTEIGWQLFPTLREKPRQSIRLSLHGVAGSGQIVRLHCFLDDVSSITSDPLNRSSWQAAMKLLDQEMPELSEMFALFELPSLLLGAECEGEDKVEQSPLANLSGPTAGSRDLVEPPKVADKPAIWPPRPMDEAMYIPGAARGLAAGKLDWFNRILAAFARPSSEGLSDAPVWEASDDANESALISEQNARHSRGIREQVDSSTKRLCNHLHRLEPNKVLAARILPLGTFMMLATLRASRLASRQEVEGIDEVTPVLCRRWFEVLFGDRDQGDENVGNGEPPYDNDLFPPLVPDCVHRHGTNVNPELAAIWTVAFAHVVAASESLNDVAPAVVSRGYGKPTGESLFIHWLLFAGASETSLQQAVQDENHLNRIWKNYFEGDPGLVTWPEVRKAVMRLKDLRWTDHRSMARLEEILSLTAANAGTSRVPHALAFVGGPRQIREVTRAALCCPNERCPGANVESPQFRRLRELTPVICPKCRQLLVPEPMWSERMKARNV